MLPMLKARKVQIHSQSEGKRHSFIELKQHLKDSRINSGAWIVFVAQALSSDIEHLLNHVAREALPTKC